MVEMLVSYCTTKWRWSRQQGVLAVLSSSWRRAQIERTALYPRVCKMVDVVFDSCAGCEMAPAVKCRDLSWTRHCQRHPLTRRPATSLDKTVQRHHPPSSSHVWTARPSIAWLDLCICWLSPTPNTNKASAHGLCSCRSARRAANTERYHVWSLRRLGGVKGASGETFSPGAEQRMFAAGALAGAAQEVYVQVGDGDGDGDATAVPAWRESNARWSGRAKWSSPTGHWTSTSCGRGGAGLSTLPMRCIREAR
jgi:hypothetical protein